VKRISLVVLFAMVLGVMVVFVPRAHGDTLGSFLKDLQQKVTGSGLSEDTIVRGLKEALEIGTEKAVSRVSQVDGYYRNPNIRIPLPGPVEKAESVLRTVGYGDQVDAFEKSMNRAAERAAPEAKRLFWEAIRQMKVEDARNILEGSDDAATQYFKEKTSVRLHEIFKPIVHDTMGEVGATRYYQDLDRKVTSMPFGETFRFDLDEYVTDEALDGLFYMVAQEEKRIRQDPAARVTDLLKEVFGE
jgi:hypothetical protein